MWSKLREGREENSDLIRIYFFVIDFLESFLFEIGLLILTTHQNQPMSKNKQILLWTARVVVAVLFLFSGISKMYKIWMFEKQLVDLGLTDWCWAPYVARFIIALEMAIGVAVLQKHWLKRFVLPVTALLLVAFNIHLAIEMYKHGPMNGNCGCFGQLIEMTPLEAFVKNLITLGIIGWIYIKVADTERDKHRFMVPMFIFAIWGFFMFAYFPFCPCEPESTSTETLQYIDESSNAADTLQVASGDTLQIPLVGSDTASTSQIAAPEPPQVKSKFSEFSQFGSKKVNLDKGKKIVCMFAPGCEHCRQTAIELKALSAKMKMPEVYILFMDEEPERIPEFFEETKFNKPYTVLSIPKFWGALGQSANTPGVVYLWNGNVIRLFEGTEGNKFDANSFKSVVEAELKDIELKY